MDNVLTRSFWLEGAYEHYQPCPPLLQDTTCDFAIIGGGFTGMSAAYHLKQSHPDMDIVIIESQVNGFGASGRNDGFNMTLMGENILELVRIAGEQNARAAHAWAIEAVQTVHDIVQKHHIPCDYEHNGFLLIGLTKPHIQKIKKETDTHNRLGTPATYLTASQVRELLPTTNACAGMLDPHCGILNPAKYCRAMRQILLNMGVRIYENTQASKIAEGTTIRITTPSATITAPSAMIATNAYTSKIGYFRHHVFPLFTYIVLTEPLTDHQLNDIGWSGRQGIETARRFVHYMRLTADNRIAIGGGDAVYYYNYGTTRDTNTRIFDLVQRELATLFPPLKNIRITHRWGGPIACTVDFFPTAGTLGPHHNLYYSLGYTGHGVSLANASGKIITDLYNRTETHRTKLFFINRRPLPFPPEPLLYPSIQTYRNYLRLRDALDNQHPYRNT